MKPVSSLGLLSRYLFSMNCIEEYLAGRSGEACLFASRPASHGDLQQRPVSNYNPSRLLLVTMAFFNTSSTVSNC